MTEMEIDGLSLGDVIRKKGLGKGAGRQRRGNQRTGRDGGIRKPKNAWQHDKFFETQRGGGRGQRRGSGSGPSSGKAIARLSNLPFSVGQQDLNDLFEQYRLSKITLFYDENRRSLGTAELHGPSGAIQRVAREFKGVEIDGRPLKLDVVGAGGSSSGGIRARLSGGGLRRQGGIRRPQRGGVKSGGGGNKKKLTPEELDAELDEYMKGSTKA